MIKTDGRPTIAWAPRVTSEPPPEPPRIAPPAPVIPAVKTA